MQGSKAALKPAQVVPVAGATPSPEGADAEAAIAAANKASANPSVRQLRISAVVDYAPDSPASSRRTTKNGAKASDSGMEKDKDTSVHDTQNNRLDATMKALRKSSVFSTTSLSTIATDDEEDGKHEDGEGVEVGPWSILKKDQQRNSLWSRAKAKAHALNQEAVIRPGNRKYRNWFYIAVIAALISGWVIPFHFAFGPPGGTLLPFTQWTSYIELLSTAIFFVDFVLRFFVAYVDPDTGMLVTKRPRIARHYATSRLFWADLLGWLPLDWLSADVAAAAGAGEQTLVGLAWLKLIHLVRMYRLFDLFADLDYRMVLSQGLLMILRNYTYVIYITHWAACVLYHIAHAEGFSPTSWVGRNAASFAGRPTGQAYLQALYFSVSAFTGLGDSALYAGTVAEAAFMIVYLLFNLFLAAYILGTVTVLVVKNDERSKAFRDKFTALNEFAKQNELPDRLQRAMQDHLEVTFHSEQVDDEHVLGIYPATIRRKVLRHLYLQPVRGCYLFKGCKQRFMDALLTAARVEMFMPGVQVMIEGDNVTELNIIVSGEAVVAAAGINLMAAFSAFAASDPSHKGDSSTRKGPSGSFKDGSQRAGSMTARSMGSMSGRSMGSMNSAKDFSVHSANGFAELMAGKAVTPRYSSDVLAEVAYFTDVPSNETIMSTSVVRVLSLPKAAWEGLMEQFPQQARLVLQNLQHHADIAVLHELRDAADSALLSEEQMRAVLSLLRDKTGATRSTEQQDMVEKVQATVAQSQLELLQRLDDVRALVRSHIRKVDQVRTFDFLGAASDGKVEALRTMLAQGVSPNAADYDGRTGLMLAAVHGHEAVVRLLLDSGAKADQLDAFGNTAMAEAVKNSHDNIIDIMLSYGATLGMEAMAVASVMCQAVFEGDLVKLRRLLKSGAPPDACDYDRRCALHIAGAEGNLAADRWGNTALDEARRVGAAPVVAYLEELLGAEVLAGGAQRHREQLTQQSPGPHRVQACSLGDAERARFIAANGQPGCVYSGLVLAASKGHKEVVEVLTCWVPPEPLTRQGPLALAEAVRGGQAGPAAALRAAGVRLADPRDPELLAAGRDAVLAGDGATVAAMLAAGVALAAERHAAGTLLHAAAAAGNLEVVRRLVEDGGARPNAEDAAGKTPAAVADAAKQPAVAEYLRWAAACLAAAVDKGAGAAAAAAELAAAAASSKWGPLPDLTAAHEKKSKSADGAAAAVVETLPDDDDLPPLLANIMPPSRTPTGGTLSRQLSKQASATRGPDRGPSGRALSQQPSVSEHRTMARPPSSQHNSRRVLKQLSSLTSLTRRPAGADSAPMDDIMAVIMAETTRRPELNSGRHSLSGAADSRTSTGVGYIMQPPTIGAAARNTASGAAVNGHANGHGHGHASQRSTSQGHGGSTLPVLPEEDRDPSTGSTHRDGANAIAPHTPLHSTASDSALPEGTPAAAGARASSRKQLQPPEPAAHRPTSTRPPGLASPPLPPAVLSLASPSGRVRAPSPLAQGSSSGQVPGARPLSRVGAGATAPSVSGGTGSGSGSTTGGGGVSGHHPAPPVDDSIESFLSTPSPPSTAPRSPTASLVGLKPPSPDGPSPARAGSRLAPAPPSATSAARDAAAAGAADGGARPGTSSSGGVRSSSAVRSSSLLEELSELTAPQP
ncbi:hypothetical protein HYH03_008087 [Edaphochlamys debaryana]|uniref:Cyclic nucleotide-binding domain-containing protein n=1 Tax=Edaphochlamys debaryana TaxID=47281 RepID=A0A835Y2P1_9CHLO|nr:hypothetical protein HYH03_008087 [Edaphochlamys debaryana]|eukprot:KAG2493568.1 hypothetical protein HYH03_008087 [Edaphochlamys debaryana]